MTVNRSSMSHQGPHSSSSSPLTHTVHTQHVLAGAHICKQADMFTHFHKTQAHAHCSRFWNGFHIPAVFWLFSVRLTWVMWLSVNAVITLPLLTLHSKQQDRNRMFLQLTVTSMFIELWSDWMQLAFRTPVLRWPALVLMLISHWVHTNTSQIQYSNWTINRNNRNACINIQWVLLGLYAWRMWMCKGSL